MKMMKTLAAFAFAMGLMFVAGGMDAQAFGSYAGGDFTTADCGGCHSAQTTADGNTMGDNDGTAEVPALMTGAGTGKDHKQTCGSDGSGGCHDNAPGPEHYSADNVGTTANCNECHTKNNSLPTASDASATTTEDAPVNGDVSGNVTDANGIVDTYTFTAKTQPANGTVTMNTDGTFTYTPNANFSGIDTFTYEVSDGMDVASATVSITVTSVNDAGPVAGDDTATTIQGEAVVIDVAANDTDVDGDTLTVAVGTIDSTMGTIALTDGKITYTPDADFVGDATFTYTISDGIESTTGNVTVTVLPDTDGDGIENGVDTDDDNDTILDGADQDSTVAATPVEDAATAKALDGAKASGQLEGFDATKTTPVVLEPLHGTLTIDETGAWTYTPDAGFEGEDSFTITYFNGTDVVEYTVTLTVTAADPGTPGGTTPPPTLVVDPDGEEGTEETPESTNPETGGTAGLMLSLAATTVAGAGLVVFRKKN